jgi:hypothetical protein
MLILDVCRDIKLYCNMQIITLESYLRSEEYCNISLDYLNSMYIIMK